jgi:hypothetical protein
MRTLGVVLTTATAAVTIGLLMFGIDDLSVVSRELLC